MTSLPDAPPPERSQLRTTGAAVRAEMANPQERIRLKRGPGEEDQML